MDCHCVAECKTGTDRQEGTADEKNYDLQEQDLMKPNIKTSLVTMTTKVTEGQQVFKLSCRVVFGLDGLCECLGQLRVLICVKFNKKGAFHICSSEPLTGQTLTRLDFTHSETQISPTVLQSRCAERRERCVQVRAAMLSKRRREG